MTQRRRLKLSANQRTALWSRWKAGQSLHEIGRAFGKDHVSIHWEYVVRGRQEPTLFRWEIASVRRRKYDNCEIFFLKLEGARSPACSFSSSPPDLIQM
jgi:hypothetical protein